MIAKIGHCEGFGGAGGALHRGRCVRYTADHAWLFAMFCSLCVGGGADAVLYC